MKTQVGSRLSRANLRDEGWQHVLFVAEENPGLTDEVIGNGIERLLVRPIKGGEVVDVVGAYKHEEYDLNLPWWERGKQHLK